MKKEKSYTVEELRKLFKKSPYSSKKFLHFFKWIEIQELPKKREYMEAL